MKYTEKEYKTMHFFKNLPNDMQLYVESEVKYYFEDVDLMRIQEHRTMLNEIYSLTPEKAEHITQYTDDFYYFTIVWLFETIQPILDKFFIENDYYEKYPEYLV